MAKFVCAKLNKGTCDKCPRYCSAAAYVQSIIAENPGICIVHTVIPDGAQLALWNVWVNDVIIPVHTIRLSNEEYAQEQQQAINAAVRIATFAGATVLDVTKAVPQFERYGHSV